MTLKLSELTKDKSKIDIEDISSDWLWLISEQKDILLITVFGDLFLIGPNNEINWLDTGTGKIKKVSESVKHFEELLKDKSLFSEWFLTELYTELRKMNILLEENEIYGFKKIPLLGGEYSIENIEPTDLSVNFSITGQLCEKATKLDSGTKVNLEIKPVKWWKIWK